VTPGSLAKRREKGTGEKKSTKSGTPGQLCGLGVPVLAAQAVRTRGPASYYAYPRDRGDSHSGLNRTAEPRRKRAALRSAASRERQMRRAERGRPGASLPITP